jgi:hypothetical protein
MNDVAKTYLRFAAMIATSTAVMYGLTYLNTYKFDHVFFSETRCTWPCSWAPRWR